MKVYTADVPPLVVDLEGSLFQSDLKLESGLAYFKSHPIRFFKSFLWVAINKTELSEDLAWATLVDVSVLPYDVEVLAFIDAERKQGRRIVLAATGSTVLVERIAEHLKLFDQIIIIDRDRKSEHTMRYLLIENFGEGGFDYLGSDNMPLREAARHVYLVNSDGGVFKRTGNFANVTMIMSSNGSSLLNWFQTLRLHQWLKNLLVFVPLFTAHRFTDISLVLDGLLAFILFGLCASSVYLLNDLMDIGDDRRHPAKGQRPLAAGRLSLKSGLIVSSLLLVLAFVGALLLLPQQFVEVLAIYYGATLAYSVWLKRYLMIDVGILASLYTLRIIAGAAAVQLPLTSWLLGFSMFLFFSLALVKRYAELQQAKVNYGVAKINGRDYGTDDLVMIAALGATAGYMAVLILVLYINDIHTTMLYRYPRIIWLACPLLMIWISRIWMLTFRGCMDEDPLLFAICDRTSLITGALSL